MGLEKLDASERQTAAEFVTPAFLLVVSQNTFHHVEGATNDKDFVPYPPLVDKAVTRGPSDTYRLCRLTRYRSHSGQWRHRCCTFPVTKPPKTQPGRL
jgi:hypothetical protein